MKPTEILKNGIIDENPTFVQVIGMCPILAVSTSVANGIGMGVAATAVLTCSNTVISLMRKLVPDTVRIPCFIVVIASFTTVVQFLLEGFMPELNNALGIFIPLIVVNCIILARAEAFASKNGVAASALDGIGMGLGFTAALIAIGAIREFFGAGSILGMTLLPEWFPRAIVMILPPGAFFTLGLLMALFVYLRSRS
ncbi:MAG: electron transport complex subunit E [Defluviitaleaceae bacterium]|nr:electron transport complex subunit E [Defluviitaleaceae bacterium]